MKVGMIDNWVENLQEELTQYCYGLELSIALGLESGGMVSVTLKSNEYRGLVEEILSEYQKNYRTYRVYEPIFGTDRAALIQSCKFEKFELLVKENLNDIIDWTISSEFNSDIYSIGCWAHCFTKNHTTWAPLPHLKSHYFNDN